MKTSSEEMVELIKQLIQNQLDELDQLVVCQIVECNKNGTYNVKVVPILNDSPVISNVKSSTYLDLNTNDFVYAMSVKNQLNNLIIFAKIGTELPKEYLDKGEIQSMINNALSNYIPTLPDGQAASQKYVDRQIDTFKQFGVLQLPAMNPAKGDDWTLADVLGSSSCRVFCYSRRNPAYGTGFSTYLCVISKYTVTRPLRRTLVVVRATRIPESYGSYYFSTTIQNAGAVYLKDVFSDEHFEPDLPSPPNEEGLFGLRVTYDESEDKFYYSWEAME